jgi:hypothetical protein
MRNGHSPVLTDRRCRAIADIPVVPGSVLLELIVASVLLVAALEKSLDPAHWRAALARYPVRRLNSKAVVMGVPIIEAVTAASIALGIAPLGGVLASLLFGAFAVMLGVAVRRGYRGDCGCFGRRSPSRVGRAPLLRAVLLAMLGIGVAKFGGDQDLSLLRLTGTWTLAVGWMLVVELSAQSAYRTRAA